MPDEMKEPSGYKLRQKALTAVEKALDSKDQAEALFGNAETIKILTYLKARDPSSFARVRNKVKNSKIDTNDFDQVLRAEARKLHLVKKGVKGPWMPELLENELGYFKQIEKDDGLEPLQISNFLIRVRERLTMPGGEEVVVANVIINRGKPREYNLAHRAFLSWRELEDSLKTTETQWRGNNMDVQLLRGNLSKQDAPRMLGTEIMGVIDIE